MENFCLLYHSAGRTVTNALAGRSLLAPLRTADVLLQNGFRMNIQWRGRGPGSGMDGVYDGHEQVKWFRWTESRAQTGFEKGGENNANRDSTRRHPTCEKRREELSHCWHGRLGRRAGGIRTIFRAHAQGQRDGVCACVASGSEPREHDARAIA